MASILMNSIRSRAEEKTTDIWFNEKDPIIHIRTHNTILKNRLTASYSAKRRRAAKKRGVHRKDTGR